MAFKLYDFKCVKCNLVQEQLVTNTAGLAEESCKQCAAGKEFLTVQLTNPKHAGHVSWSLWKV